MTYPNLTEVDVTPFVEKKGGGKGFQARYVSWANIARLLMQHAPGWQPFLKENDSGGHVWSAPTGGFYILVGFRHPDPEMPDTECIPFPIMDDRMNAAKDADARDLTDTFARGYVKAAAWLFGLGLSLWTKDDPFARDNGHHEEPPPRPTSRPAPAPYDLPDEASAAIAQAHTNEGLQQIGARIRASGFQGVDAKQLRELFAERKAELEAKHGT